MNNQVAVRNKTKFSVAITTDSYRNLINNTLRDPERANRFIASITSAVAVNEQLQDCDAGSILAGAFLGESLKLSPSPQLGQYYLVPFNQKTNQKDETGNFIYEKKAQFQLGYKGYIQLAIRSGQYKKLNVLEIKEGELVRYNPLTEDLDIRLIEDEAEREKANTIGYYAMFEYLNGFVKSIYWTKAKMEAHALTYSQGYKAKKGYTFWEKDFDSMAKKTMLRQLISKWGVMSTEFEKAYMSDMGVVDDKGNITYVDTEIDTPPASDKTISMDEL